LLRVLAGLSKWFQQAHYDLIVKYLDRKLPTTGINFGIAAGGLNRDKIFQKNEYFGDPIIIASRLQGAIARKTDAPGYKALISFSAFNSHFESAVASASVVGKFDLNLRNVGKTRCRLIKL
jgi:class 3 adenylate cyclase